MYTEKTVHDYNFDIIGEHLQNWHVNLYSKVLKIKLLNKTYDINVYINKY